MGRGSGGSGCPAGPQRIAPAGARRAGLAGGGHDRYGRPHQIRIHTAAAGAPLLGDPLYAPGGLAAEQALPGDGGYHLHAHRLRLVCPDGDLLALEAPLPEALRGAADG
jgi:hypothetical protein